MIDLGYALIVFAVIAAFYMLAGAFNRAVDKQRRTQPDTCRCGHETDWHRHLHSRTYCAAIDCACHTYRRTK